MFKNFKFRASILTWRKQLCFILWISIFINTGWGVAVAQAVDPFYGDLSPSSNDESTLGPKNTSSDTLPSSRESGIKQNLSEQFETTKSIPDKDFFQGELGEAYSSFTETPFIEDKAFGGWREFSLGMSYEEVTNLIKSSAYPWLTIKGDYEPVLTLETNNFFVETYANRYFKNIQFLFDQEQKLYLIRLLPLSSYFSFLELIDQFKKKYGKPSELNFQHITWIDKEGNRLELSRDSTIRYIYTDILTNNQLNNQATLETPSPIEAEKNAFRTDLLESF